LIPGENDDKREIKNLVEWVIKELGPETPLHFSAFHPDFKMTDRSATPLSTLIEARDLALEIGLNHVYTGNVYYAPGDITYCRRCGEELIVREWYSLVSYRLTGDGCCRKCGARLAGWFDKTAGDWGSKRKPIRI
jgi:pyruvate formate lyase activating enzyme